MGQIQEKVSEERLIHCFLLYIKFRGRGNARMEQISKMLKDQPFKNDLIKSKVECSCDLNETKVDASKVDADSSVEIISNGAMFSPYKSNLHREFNEEDRMCETQAKKCKRIAEWKWDEVINIDSSDEDDKEDNIDDTADSSQKFKIPIKIPRVSIRSETDVI